GSAWGNLQETAAFLDRLFARGQGNPLLFPNLVFNAPLSYASIELGITGPTAMLSAEEASGEAAIAWGAEQVGEGAVDVCLAGGRARRRARGGHGRARRARRLRRRGRARGGRRGARCLDRRRAADPRARPPGARGPRRGHGRRAGRPCARRRGGRARPRRVLPGAVPGGRVKQPLDPFPRLPHAAPFLLLDRVLEIGERTGAFSKLVSAADPCVGRDGELPASFVIEALAQGG